MLLDVDDKVRWLLLGLGDGRVFDFEAGRVLSSVEHATNAAKLLLGRVRSAVLVNHALDEVGCQLGLAGPLGLLRLLLLHLHLDVCDSGRCLAIDHEVGRRRGRLPDLVLTDDLDSSVLVASLDEPSHQRGLLAVSARIEHLGLLTQVGAGPCHLGPPCVVLSVRIVSFAASSGTVLNRSDAAAV